MIASSCLQARAFPVCPRSARTILQPACGGPDSSVTALRPRSLRLLVHCFSVPCNVLTQCKCQGAREAFAMQSVGMSGATGSHSQAFDLMAHSAMFCHVSDVQAMLQSSRGLLALQSAHCLLLLNTQ